MEEFKALEEVENPDSRWSYFVMVDRQTGEKTPMTLKDHYSQVAHYKLNASVPEDIQSQFNIAKNVLVYAWYEYNFFAVAPFQALSTLELALRTRIGKSEVEVLRQKKQAGMYGFIKYSITRGWIQNQDFEAWHNAPVVEARQKYLMKKIEEMNELGVDSIQVDYEEVEVPEENTYDLLQRLQKTVNKIRNSHAHGETILSPQHAWDTFEMCSDYINALYRNK